MRSPRPALGICLLLIVCFQSDVPAQTGTFVDRRTSTDLRLLTYNPFWDQIFPDESTTNAAKFARIVDAVQPDVINLQEINRSASDVIGLLNDIAPLSGGASWQAFQGRDNIIASPYPLFERRSTVSPAGDRDLAIARVDLPDAAYARDFYIMNNHYACCSGGESGRQQQSDALVSWMRDARTTGGFIDLPGQTPMAVLGDLNIVGGPQPLQTLITGNIIDEQRYGADSVPDWEQGPLADARPRHNQGGVADYTWRDDGSSFDPGRLDYVIYTDSVLDLVHGYVLNTREMNGSELAATGLQADDVVLNPATNRFDHLPLVTDFQVATLAEIGDLSGDGILDPVDLQTLQSEVVLGTDQLRFDLNGDRQVDSADVDYWITDIYGTLPGDANLDRVVDGQDYIAWNNHKFGSSDWLGGDFNSDGLSDGQDFIVWNNNKFTAAFPVPESVTLSWMMPLCLWMLSSVRRKGIRCHPSVD